MKDWAMETLSDPSFMGALLGALITGFIAVCIMMVTLKTENKRTERISVEGFVKEATFFFESVKSLLETAKNYAVLQEREENLITKQDEEGFPSEEALDIAFGKEIIEKDMINSLAAINTVERSYFTHDSIEPYIEIRCLITNGIEYFWQRSLKHSGIGISDVLHSYISKTEIELVKIEKVIEINKRKIK